MLTMGRYGWRGEQGGEATHQRGQVMVEATVGVLAIMGMLVVMFVYGQRAMQGHLYEAGSSHGQQYDPDEDYLDIHTLSDRVDKTTRTVGFSLMAADFIPPVGPGPTGQGDPAMTFNSAPVGPVFREPARQQKESSTTWQSEHEVTYDVPR